MQAAQHPERRRTCAAVCMDAGILEKAGIFPLVSIII
jgi:hypothetical protein